MLNTSHYSNNELLLLFKMLADKWQVFDDLDLKIEYKATYGTFNTVVLRTHTLKLSLGSVSISTTVDHDEVARLRGSQWADQGQRSLLDSDPFTEMFNIDFMQIPLHLNIKDSVARKVINWRLNIGR